MRALYLMCGLPFAGKTTVAERLAARLGLARVSLDEINRERGMRGGEGIPVEEWERTHAVAASRAERLIAEGRQVVIDDTSCFRFLRDRYRLLAQRHGLGLVVVLVDTPVAEIRLRLAANHSSGLREPVDRDLFARMVREFEWPAADEDVRRLCAEESVDAWLAASFPVLP